MAHRTVVINVVGLSRSLLSAAPRLHAFAEEGVVRPLRPVLPAVTCSVQASMLTGLPVREHGIVGNGWYNRELAEVQFWRQSHHLVQGEKVWETARRRDPSVTCANLFWWFNMYSSADYTVAPRPVYKADGRKLPDLYTQPGDLRGWLRGELGQFPLFNFWGPRSDITSSRWIAEAAKLVFERCQPTLTLVYLPHLDYALQKLGPAHGGIPTAVGEIDAVVGELLGFFQERGVRVMIVSEYGIEAVDGPVHINRALRQAGLLRVREEDGLELLDAGASAAFAVADHQVAHVYVRGQGSGARSQQDVAAVCRGLPGVEQVLDREGQAAAGIDHPRAGDLVLVAAPGKWFTYYYWLDDAKAPDFGRTVDIHRKPGYDPVELFLDPALRLPALTIGWKLLKRKLGFRGLLDVIPLDAALVRGSHGRVDLAPDLQPVLITQRSVSAEGDALPCTAVPDIILDHLFGP